MVKSVGGNNERSDCQRVFSKFGKKTGSESKVKSKCNNNHDQPWKYSIVLISIKNYRKSRVPMQIGHTNGRPSDILVQKAKE
jgi:hypothetical protein